MGGALDTQYCVEAYHSLVPHFADADVSWLREKREQSIQSFEKYGFPSIKDENWKYTNLRSVTKSAYEFSDETEEKVSEVPAIPDLDSIRLVFVDGLLQRSLCNDSDLPAGVLVSELSTAVNERAELLQDKLGSLLPGEPHGFLFLNGAFLNSGVVIEIADDVTLEKPIELLYLCSGAAERIVQPRNLVVAGACSRAQIIERAVGLQQSRYLNNSVTEIFVGPRAELELSRVQEESAKATHIAGVFSSQKADSVLTVNTVALGGQLIRNDIHLSLDEPGATCHLNGLSVTDGRQHVDNFTQINHQVEQCTSRELFKGVLDGRSRNVFHGRIVVAKDAQQTDSEQQNQNLLLSRDAEIDTKPQLEIYADDVKCSHGATVGQLDENSLFYLRSRGIEEHTARGMLTYAFADAALMGISNEALKKHIERNVSSSLGEDD